MYRLLKTITFFVMILLFISGCSSTSSGKTSYTYTGPNESEVFNSFEDNQTYQEKFAGIWTQETLSFISSETVKVRYDGTAFYPRSGSSKVNYYYILEFKTDGTGFYRAYEDNELKHSTPFKYKTSESQIYLYYFSDSLILSIADYHFTDNNTLTFINWSIRYSSSSYWIYNSGAYLPDNSTYHRAGLDLTL